MEAQLYWNASILTMEGAAGAPRPEALLVRGGRIAALGGREALLRLAPGAERIDLGGGALLPGFIDAHSHITAYAQTMGLLDLTGAASFEQIAVRVAAFRQAQGREAGAWVIGFGYDHNTLAQRRHPDREALDAICPDAPLLIAHKSGHMGAANSLALRRMGIDAATPDPSGGRLGREADGRTPNGYLEEAAFHRASAAAPAPTREELLQMLQQAQERYLSYGVTTVQDGLTRAAEWSLLAEAARRGLLLLDVVSYVDEQNSPAVFVENRAHWSAYRNRLRLGGYKILLDGSPQGRTAWLSAPYEGEKAYRGYPTHTDGEVEGLVRRAMEEGAQLLAHCNGDAAAEQLLQAFERAAPHTDARPVMIHAQAVRRDQLPRLARIGMFASFFPAHVYHWGDTHLLNLGPARAAAISPAKSALEAGVRFTFHQDTPVLPPDMLETIWCAALRQTRSGRVLGGEECIPVYDALRAVTIDAARQYFEEAEKGSLAPGKRADFAILSADPLACPPERLRDIRVRATIKDGECLYCAR